MKERTPLKANLGETDTVMPAPGSLSASEPGPKVLGVLGRCATPSAVVRRDRFSIGGSGRHGGKGSVVVERDESICAYNDRRVNGRRVRGEVFA